MKYYLAVQHNINKALGAMDYPVSKKELISRVGSERIRTDHRESIPFRNILEKLPKEEYSCASDLYCCINAVLSSFA